VFGLGAATRIYLAPGATDMRKGFNGLYGLVRDQLLCDPLSGHLFLFSNAQRNRLKILFWDTTGLWVCANLGPRWGERDTRTRRSSRS
jgi:transposase